MLPVERGEDVAIDIGIGVANLYHIGLGDPAVAVLVDEVNITGLEVAVGIAGKAGGIAQIAILACGGGSGIVGEDAVGLESIEHTCCLAFGGEHVVGAVDGGGVALDGLIDISLGACCIEVVGGDGGSG